MSKPSLNFHRSIAYKYKNIPIYHNTPHVKKTTTISTSVKRFLEARFEPEKVLWTSLAGAWQVSQYAVLGCAVFGIYVYILDYLTGWYIWIGEDDEGERG